MQSESKNRNSFFDSDDVNVLFIFKKIDKNNKDVELPPIIRDNLSRQVAGSSTAPLLGSYALHNRSLVFYKVWNLCKPR